MTEDIDDLDFDRATDEVKALRERLDQSGYILRHQDGMYLVTDLDGAPVHETDQTAYSQDIDDVRFWVAELCTPDAED